MEIKTSGPLFDGSFPRLVQDFIDDAEWEVGAQASANVHQNADGSFKNPTPYYETQIAVERRDPDVVVHDRGIVYGPWLEGVSTRNQLTRFKGYRIWARAANQTRRQANAIVQQVLQRHLVRMRGGV